MQRMMTICVSRKAKRWVMIGSLMSLCSFYAVPSWADYCYGGTQLSWEWLTDASRVIVVGKVVTCNETGEFTIQVDKVLKQCGLDVASGQSLGGPILGRGMLYGQAPILREAGWPSLRDPTTYPDAGPKITSLRPRFHQIKSWAVGDRCIVFYAIDLQTPLQIINLDKPYKIEVEFLAVDLAGQIVTSAEEVIKRITARVDKSLVDGRPQVETAGISYTIWKSPLDGADYYSVLAPPDKRLATLWDSVVLTGLEPRSEGKSDEDKRRQREHREALETHSIPWSPPSGEPRQRAMAPLAAWYWFHSGKTTKDFATAARAELNAVIKEAIKGWGFKGRELDRIKTEMPRVDVYGRSLVFRSHRTSYRTFPLGWLCVLSYDMRYIATVDGRRLEVHSIDQSTWTVDRCLHISDDVRRYRTSVEFSRDGRYLAYTTADGSLCLFDLRDERLGWKRRAFPDRPQSQITWHVRSSLLQFSHANRYLALQSRLAYPQFPERPDPGGRYHNPQFVQVWDVATGNIALTPYDDWANKLRLYQTPFDPDNEDVIRLQSPIPDNAEGIIATHELWSISSQKKLRVIPRRTSWNSPESKIKP